VVAGRRIATMLIFCSFCVLTACVSRSIYFDSLRPVPPTDSSRSSITDVSSGVRGGVSLPHRNLIRVDFTSGTDLRDMVVLAGNILSVHCYFCDRGEDVAELGGPGVYVDLTDAGKEKLVKKFLFLLDVSRKASPGSTGFDLSAYPEDICFYVTARGVTTTYKSNVERIPKTAIEQVFIGWDLR
jgi:hypothetical protein